MLKIKPLWSVVGLSFCFCLIKISHFSSHLYHFQVASGLLQVSCSHLFSDSTYCADWWWPVRAPLC
jgi:hypothetical protein